MKNILLCGIIVFIFAMMTSCATPTTDIPEQIYVKEQVPVHEDHKLDLSGTSWTKLAYVSITKTVTNAEAGHPNLGSVTSTQIPCVEQKYTLTFNTDGTFTYVVEQCFLPAYDGDYSSTNMGTTIQTVYTHPMGNDIHVTGFGGILAFTCTYSGIWWYTLANDEVEGEYRIKINERNVVRDVYSSPTGTGTFVDPYTMGSLERTQTLINDYSDEVYSLVSMSDVSVFPPVAPFTPGPDYMGKNESGNDIMGYAVGALPLTTPTSGFLNPTFFGIYAKN